MPLRPAPRTPAERTSSLARRIVGTCLGRGPKSRDHTLPAQGPGELERGSLAGVAPAGPTWEEGSMRFLVADHWPLARWPGPGCSLVRAGLGEGPAQQRVRSGVEMTAGQWALLSWVVSLSEDGSWYALLRQ